MRVLEWLLSLVVDMDALDRELDLALTTWHDGIDRAAGVIQ